MAAIIVSKYQIIADKYADAQKRVVGVVDYYFDAAYEIVLLQVFDPELDLLTPFYNAYLSAKTTYSTAPQSAVVAVQKLQQHILSKSRDSTGDRYTNINDWLDAAGTNGSNTLAGIAGRTSDSNASIKVESEFAALSAQAGFAIDAENIN